MPLVPATLQTAIEDAYKANVPNATADQLAQISAMASAISIGIDTYIKSGLVSVNTVCPAGVGTGTGLVS